MRRFIEGDANKRIDGRFILLRSNVRARDKFVTILLKGYFPNNKHNCSRKSRKF